MDGILNENQLTIFKEFEFDKPLNQKIDAITDNCIRGCHNKYFHTFDHICVYDIKLTNIRINEITSLTSADENMNL